MPALPVVPDVLKVTLSVGNDVDVNKTLNILHFGYSTAAPDSTACATLAAAIEGYWSTNCKSLLTSSSALDEVKVTDLSSDSGGVGTWTGSTTGTRAGQINSAQLAFLVQMLIATRYRGGKPKTFLPFGVAPDLTNQGAWGGSFITAVTDGWNAFIAAILADTSAVTFTNQVCVSYYGPPNVVITNPVTGRARTVSTVRAVPKVYPITGYTYQTEVATQRRRTGRRR